MAERAASGDPDGRRRSSLRDAAGQRVTRLCNVPLWDILWNTGQSPTLPANDHGAGRNGPGVPQGVPRLFG